MRPVQGSPQLCLPGRFFPKPPAGQEQHMSITMINVGLPHPMWRPQALITEIIVLAS